ncbi:MAG: HD domain-containing protein [Desulfobacterales bacterium]|jgi:hypothetical protein
MNQRDSNNRIPIYLQIRQRARQIVSHFPSPDFYRDFYRSDELSRHLLESNPLLAKIKLFVKGNIEDDFGHGLQHAIKVAIDAGTLTLIEGRRMGYSEKFTGRRMLIAQCAGLLHDIKRKQKNHSIIGAAYARELLKRYAFKPDEIQDIGRAIHNHEAFKTDIAATNTRRGALVSDCLYDADKFRWGPDNFIDTVWDMVLFHNPPLTKFVNRYPKGMESLVKIKSTFRTPTGKQYGPQFIDLGLAIGEKLYDVITSEFARYL